MWYKLTRFICLFSPSRVSVFDDFDAIVGIFQYPRSSGYASSANRIRWYYWIIVGSRCRGYRTVLSKSLLRRYRLSCLVIRLSVWRRALDDPIYRTVSPPTLPCVKIDVVLWVVNGIPRRIGALVSRIYSLGGTNVASIPYLRDYRATGRRLLSLLDFNAFPHLYYSNARRRWTPPTYQVHETNSQALQQQVRPLGPFTVFIVPCGGLFLAVAACLLQACKSATFRKT